jgi:TPR repeat protein
MRSMRTSFRRAAFAACAAAAASLAALSVVAAEAGTASDEYRLSRYYAGATGTAVDLGRAFDHLRRAAELGSVPAQAELAFVYKNGNARVPKEPALALRWFGVAAEGGSVRAQCMLGDFLQAGWGGVDANPAAAVAWYTRAALSDDPCAPKAQYELYVAYESGTGVERDLATATRWLQQAAGRGNPIAQQTLGRNHLSGHGVERDRDLAIHWLRKSREGVSPHDDELHGDDEATASTARLPSQRTTD